MHYLLLRSVLGGGGVEKWGLKLTSAKVEVEVEAELGNTPVFARKVLMVMSARTI